MKPQLVTTDLGRKSHQDAAIWPRWEASGSEEDPTSRLLACDNVTVCGVNMHVMAYAIKDDDVQDIADEYNRVEWDAICALYDFAFETFELEGRRYVIVAHPHGD